MSSAGRGPRVLLAAVCSCVLTAGCGGQPSRAGRAAPTGSTASPPPACTVIAPGFSCAMQERIGAVRRYIASVPGEVGVVLHDRLTGATWHNANAAKDFPAGSTIKLAMVTDLLVRQAAGELTLSPSDEELIHSALRSSSDAAADQLWSSFENASFLGRIRAFGMTSASFTSSPPYWGYMYCSPEDLGSLMDYVLAELPARDRDVIVSDLRSVTHIQHWGVWGAGAGNRPGNKNGWLSDNGVWIVSTVGFAGPAARYTLAAMDHLGGQAGFAAGANTLTQIAAILFQGHRVPAPRVSVTP